MNWLNTALYWLHKRYLAVFGPAIRSIPALPPAEREATNPVREKRTRALWKEIFKNPDTDAATIRRLAPGADVNRPRTIGYIPTKDTLYYMLSHAVRHDVAEVLLLHGAIPTPPYTFEGDSQLSAINALRDTMQKPNEADIGGHTVIGNRKDVQILVYTHIRIAEVTREYAYTDTLPPAVQQEVDRLQRFAAPSMSRARIYRQKSEATPGLNTLCKERVGSLPFSRAVYDEETAAPTRRPLPAPKIITFGALPEMTEALVQPETEEAEIRELGIRIYGTADDIREAFKAAHDILLLTKDAYMEEVITEDFKMPVAERLAKPETIKAVSRLYVEHAATGKPLPEFPFFRFAFDRASKTKTVDVIAGLETAMTEAEHKQAAFDKALDGKKMRVEGMPATTPQSGESREAAPPSGRKLMR